MKTFIINFLISLCMLQFVIHLAFAFDKKQVCFYQASSKRINCDCESRKGRMDAFPRYFCKNTEGLWQLFDNNEKSWQVLKAKPACMVHSARGNVRFPCYHDKTKNICACKNNKGEWKVVDDKANQWQIVQPENYQCRPNRSTSEVIIKGEEIITPSPNKEPP